MKYDIRFLDICWCQEDVSHKKSVENNILMNDWNYSMHLLSRIKELEEGKGSLVSERGQLHEEKLRLIQTLHSLHLQQEQAQHENTKIK